jgi:tetratricopeptide (TPR) repeat protein
MPAACSSSNSTVPQASIPITFAAGTAALRQHDYSAAEALFAQVIARDPGQVAAYYDLGLAYQAQHDYRDALREYAKAQALNERFVPAIYNRAVLSAPADPQLAMFLYRTVISIQPDSPTAYLNLGLLEAQQNPKLHDQAEDTLARAVQLDPSLASRIPPSLRAGLPQGGHGSPKGTR